MSNDTPSRFKRPLRACEQCGTFFQPLNDTKRYCSKTCGGMARSKPTEDRFWANVQKGDSCWTWTGAVNEHGYGRIYDKGRMQLAHRFSWMLHYGSIPIGLGVLHRCDNPPCVNPEHLFLGSQGDNMADMAAKKRQVFQRNPDRAPRGARNGNATHPETRPRGEKHHKAKLSSADVLQIRAMRDAGHTLPSLATQFGVTLATIKVIVYRKGWKHV